MEIRDFLKASGEVYGRLCDDMSRFLYEKRCMYSLTKDEKYIEEMLDCLRDKNKMDELMARMDEVCDRLVIRGAGNDFGAISKWYPNLSFKLFCDNDPVKIAAGSCYGKPLVSPDEFYEKYSDHYVLINSIAYNREIYKELTEHGISEERIFDFSSCYKYDIINSQYFDKDIMKPHEHEVFVDGGAYDGGTVLHFAEWCGGKYDRIFAYEADSQNYERCREGLNKSGLPHIELINKGLWSGDDTLSFDACGNQGSAIADISGAGDASENKQYIKTTSIDNTVGDSPVTFIKLDVEGAELETLKGAADTIKKYKPRLAISIYHLDDDIFTIPAFIAELCDEYRFYIRHYQMSRYETILYAVV